MDTHTFPGALRGSAVSPMLLAGVVSGVLHVCLYVAGHFWPPKIVGICSCLVACLSSLRSSCG